VSEDLTLLQKGKYISLKTYRKNGEGVASALWFVEENLKFVVCTGVDSFKVRRIKNNSEVQIASSNMSGKTKSNFIDAEARILTTDEIEPIIMLFRNKYHIFRLWSYLKNRKKEEEEKQIYIEITPT
jgi:PPOX class probable F420-dependent enzyme